MSLPTFAMRLDLGEAARKQARETERAKRIRASR